MSRIRLTLTPRNLPTIVRPAGGSFVVVAPSAAGKSHFAHEILTRSPRLAVRDLDAEGDLLMPRCTWPTWWAWLHREVTSASLPSVFLVKSGADADATGLPTNRVAAVIPDFDVHSDRILERRLAHRGRQVEVERQMLRLWAQTRGIPILRAFDQAIRPLFPREVQP